MKDLYSVRLARETLREKILHILSPNQWFQLQHFWARGFRPPFWLSSRFNSQVNFHHLAPAELPGDTRVMVLSDDGEIGHQIDIEEHIIRALEQGDTQEIARIKAELFQAALGQPSS